jgi:hypothetical protein
MTLLATALACSIVTTPANARARVFVASYGNDANPCTFGSPCKTFQQAVNAVDPGGEVTAIDSAGFGPINITKAVTITSPDGVEAGIVPNAGADAIDIAAGPSDAVVLRGLTLNGSGVGHNGVNFQSGGSLTVTDCIVQDFVETAGVTTGNGIIIQPTSGAVDFVITHTTVINNDHVGIFYFPPSGASPSANGVIDNVVATGNGFGIGINSQNASSGTAIVAISNSATSNHRFDGIAAQGASTSPVTISVDSSNASGNGQRGIAGSGTAKVLLGRSVIIGNATGVGNFTSPNTFFTYKDNRINQNTTDICSTSGCIPLNTTLALQ